MQIKPLQTPAIPSKPQMHSKKCHHTYNGARCLPVTSWVRSPTVLDISMEQPSIVFEIILYYQHNRACIIYRTWDDFRRLSSGVTPWENAPSFDSMYDAQELHDFLQQALAKRPNDCAVEYFLRRRMEDCGGQ